MKIIQILQNWTAESAKIKILFGAPRGTSPRARRGAAARTCYTQAAAQLAVVYSVYSVFNVYSVNNVYSV